MTEVTTVPAAAHRPRTNIEEDLTPVIRDGLLFFEHPSLMTIICLPPHHPALQSPIKEVKYSRNVAALSGKGKKGASKVEKHSYLCDITNTDGTVHKIRFGVDAMIIEGNSRLKDDPELLRRSPTYEGYLAVVLLHGRTQVPTELATLSECPC
uniref:Eukaryotic translation initiation factor 2D n=1 Tax=Panagrellus redivivus TaxID=6233 RepID=A0A7E4W243_PANRE